MPAIKIQHVVSVSSEDKSFPAENLIKNDGFKKWKCSAGEKNATVILQFEKASEINQIDIGNEGSAFIEVLVGKSSSIDDSFQVILMSSSFMNPAESRSSQNPNRVRIFGTDNLSKAVVDQKWDRVKIVCTQPFAKNTQYGLSFIKFYSAPSNDKESGENAKGSPSKQLTLGAFVVKNDRPSDTIKAGSLFEKSKHKIEEPSLTGAAAIRAASKTIEKQEDKATTSVSSNSEEASTSASKTKQSSPKAKVITAEKNSADVGEASDRSAKNEGTQNIKRGAKEDSLRRSCSPPAKKTKTEPVASSSSSSLPTSSKDKAFNKLMQGVVFVISGFQNPLRGQLRDKAQEMGATYKADWGRGCTHLICAFENTPKYNEVRGKGRIVKKDWLLDCYKQKTLLPWRQYRLGKAASPRTSDSEEEEEDKKKQRGKQIAKAEAASSGDGPKRRPDQKKQSDEDRRGPKEKGRNGERKIFHQMSIEADTDSLSDSNSADEKSSKIKAGLEKEACIPSTSAQKDAEEDIYNASTDEEPMMTEDNDSNDKFPELPDFFGGKSFFLYGKFSQENRRTLVRYITAYNGSIIDYMDETIDYVVTDEPWDENFDQAVSENGHLIFVKSSWVHACHEAQRLVPHQKFVVTAL